MIVRRRGRVGGGELPYGAKKHCNRNEEEQGLHTESSTRLPARTYPTLPFVADFLKELDPDARVFFGLNTLGWRAIHHAQNAAAALGHGDNRLDRIGCRAEDIT